VKDKICALTKELQSSARGSDDGRAGKRKSKYDHIHLTLEMPKETWVLKHHFIAHSITSEVSSCSDAA
jgi:hypothetical protein